MGWIEERSPASWRASLRTAKFRNAAFHVEQIGRQSGRRIALHEYPKRDDPYAEDMGRRTIAFDVTGYIIQGDMLLGRDYRQARNALVLALEKEGPGTLIHPTMDELQVACDRYSITETRDRGGFCTFEMHFVEAGRQANKSTSQNTQTGVGNAAAVAGPAMSSAFSTKISRWVGATK
jgi:prophage DNA circulation protein